MSSYTWRGYDHNLECLDCDEHMMNGHAPDCPFWQRVPFWAQNARRKEEPMEARPRKMGPLTSDHPMTGDGTLCPGCHKTFEVGDFVTFIPVGPGDDPGARANARAGLSYTGVAVPVHWACATGEV